MKILLTGATGFVGRHLAELLERSGHEIYYLVRRERGIENEFVWDFRNDMPDALPACDVIVHLAAFVCFGQALEVEQYLVNTVSTFKLLQYAERYGSYFIFASTVAIHGAKSSTIDAGTIVAPENHYGISKYLAEEAVRTFAKSYSVLRIGGIYGIDGPSHLGLNNAVAAAVLKGEPPVLSGSGKAKRNYICVSDVARWIVCLIENWARCDDGHGPIRETLYSADTEVMSIEKYLQTIIDVVLPGKALKRMEGNEGSDFVIVPSKPPFDPVCFRAYLQSVLQSEAYYCND